MVGRVEERWRLCTCGASRTVGADHLFGFGDDGAGGSGRTGAGPAVVGRSLRGVAVKTVLAAFAAQTGSVVLTLTGSCKQKSYGDKHTFIKLTQAVFDDLKHGSPSVSKPGSQTVTQRLQNIGRKVITTTVKITSSFITVYHITVCHAGGIFCPLIQVFRGKIVEHRGDFDLSPWLFPTLVYTHSTHIPSLLSSRQDRL